MKKIKSFAIDEEVLKKFDDTCIKLFKKHKITINKSQLIEKLLIDWMNK